MVDEKKELITLDKETYSRIMKENEIAKKILDCICNKRCILFINIRILKVKFISV